MHYLAWMHKTFSMLNLLCSTNFIMCYVRVIWYQLNVTYITFTKTISYTLLSKILNTLNRDYYRFSVFLWYFDMKILVYFELPNVWASFRYQIFQYFIQSQKKRRYEWYIHRGISFSLFYDAKNFSFSFTRSLDI